MRGEKSLVFNQDCSNVEVTLVEKRPAAVAVRGDALVGSGRHRYEIHVWGLASVMGIPSGSGLGVVAARVRTYAPAGPRPPRELRWPPATAGHLFMIGFPSGQVWR